MINIGKINDFVVLSQSGVWIIVNENKKIVQIFGSRNILQGLTNLIQKLPSSEYKNMIEDINDISFNIIEYTKDIRVCTAYWIKEYRNKGYTMYKESYLPQYVLKSEWGKTGNDLSFLVYLENAHHDKIVLGIFDNMEKGMEWKNQIYPNKVVKSIIYHSSIK